MVANSHESSLFAASPAPAQLPGLWPPASSSTPEDGRPVRRLLDDRPSNCCDCCATQKELLTNLLTQVSELHQKLDTALQQNLQSPPQQALITQPSAQRRNETAELMESLNEGEDELIPFALNLRQQGHSVGRCALGLARKIFAPEELTSTKNCSGTKGKEKLDQQRLSAIRRVVFRVYVVPQHEHDHVWRKKCMASIDEFLRRPNRNRFRQ